MRSYFFITLRTQLTRLQVDAGTSIYAVQHMLGHKNVATTQIYADMADETKRQSVDRITLKPRINPTLKVVNQ
ncbi:MAG: tyrosine-type recombinase/integrase [Paludibacteraceae bacterium]|nr:tyrosine-type recombinase/integrase [Paludibacteraceae bacterium]